MHGVWVGCTQSCMGHIPHTACMAGNFQQTTCDYATTQQAIELLNVWSAQYNKLGCHSLQKILSVKFKI